MTRTIAVDWTGAKEPLRNLCLAEANAETDRVIDVRAFSSRAGLRLPFSRRVLVKQPSRRGSRLRLLIAVMVPRESGPEDRSVALAPDGGGGERWLVPRPPFWGRGRSKGPRFKRGEDQFRQTDHDLRSRGHRPRSTLRTGRPRQVGTGSLRGMPYLAQLRSAGFHIWPSQAGWPLEVGIYPASLGEGVTKSQASKIPEAVRRICESPESGKRTPPAHKDVFDASIAVPAMARHVEELRELKAASAEEPIRAAGSDLAAIQRVIALRGGR